MSNFYLRNRHMFEEVNEIPYAYQAERLYQLLPKLKYDSKLPRDIFREKQQEDYPSKNIFAQNARTLLGANFDSPTPQLYPQQNQNQPNRNSYPAQRDSFPYKKDNSPPKDPFKRNIQPPQRDSQPFHQPNYPPQRESHQNKKEVASYDPFKRGFQADSIKGADQRSAGLSKPKYDEPSANTKRRYHHQQPSTSPFAVGDVNTEPAEPRRGGYPMQRPRIPSEYSPARDNIPAAGRAAYGRVSSALEGGPGLLDHPISSQEPVRNRGRREPSNSPPQIRQQYGISDNYANPHLRGGLPSYFEENNKTLPPMQQITEPSSKRGGYEPIERTSKREQNRSESPKYYTMGTRGSPKKITQAINESIKQNTFPNHAYINVKKRVLNVRGDLSRLDEAPFPKDKTVLTATLQARAQQLEQVGKNKTIQEALEYRILMTVPGDRKEKLKRLLQSEGSVPEGM